MAITTYATSPLLGVDLDAKSSTLTDMGHGLGTVVLAKDGFAYQLVIAGTALASTDDCIVLTTGNYTATIAASLGVATGFCKTTGGVTAGQYFWTRSKQFPGAVRDH